MCETLEMDSSEEQGLLNNNNEPKKYSHILPVKTKLAFGFGHVLNDICSSMWFTYILIFFKDVLKLDATQAGYMVLTGQIADAVANPIIGYLSDRPGSKWYGKLGKRKIWHLLGTICICGTYVFAFWPCTDCDGNYSTGLLFYYYFNIVIFQFGWAAVQISHLSLIPELTPSDTQRTDLTRYRYAATVLSSLFVYGVTFFAFGASTAEEGIGPADANTFWGIAWIELVVGVAASFIFQYFVKEKDNCEVGLESEYGNRQSFSEILRNPESYKAAVIYMSTMLFVNLTQVYIPLYVLETLQMSRTSLAVVPLTVYAGSLLMTMVVNRLNNRFGRKKAYLVGSFIGIGSCIWIYVRSSDPVFASYEIYVVALCIGVATSTILVTNLGITADLIGKNTGSGALVYSIMTVTDKLANGIVICVTENIQDGRPSREYYQNIVVYICGGAILVATLFVILMKPVQEREETTPKRSEYAAIP